MHYDYRLTLCCLLSIYTSLSLLCQQTNLLLFTNTYFNLFILLYVCIIFKFSMLLCCLIMRRNTKLTRKPNVLHAYCDLCVCVCVCGCVCVCDLVCECGGEQSAVPGHNWLTTQWTSLYIEGWLDIVLLYKFVLLSQYCVSHVLFLSLVICTNVLCSRYFTVSYFIFLLFSCCFYYFHKMHS